MTVADRITKNWPITEQVLLDTESISYPADKDLAIEDSIFEFYEMHLPEEDIPDLATVNALPSYVQQYFADKATLLLIPIARDLYKEGSLSRSLATSQGGGSGSESLYNKLQALDKLESTLLTRIHKAETLVIDVLEPPPVVSDYPTDVMRVYYSHDLDPYENAKKRRLR